MLCFLDAPRLYPSTPKLYNKVGTRLPISCVLQEGTLPVRFEWLKDGNLIAASTRHVIDSSQKASNLFLDKLIMGDTGNYSCRASNDYGFDLTVSELIVEGIDCVQRIKFTILFFSSIGPPQWSIKPKDATVDPNKPFKFSCHGIGYPIPKITWKFKDG